MNHQVFISYSSKDAAIANQIVEYLENNGYKCWIAPRNITSGHDYTDMINDAIMACRAVVVVMSRKALQSQWVKKELATATSNNKIIIPFRIEQVELSGGFLFMLNNVQWIDATSKPTSMFPDIINGIDPGKGVKVEPEAKGEGKKAPIGIIAAAAAALVIILALLIWHPWNRNPKEAEPVDPTPTPERIIDTVVVEVPVEKKDKSKNDKDKNKAKEDTKKTAADKAKQEEQKTSTETPKQETTATTTKTSTNPVQQPAVIRSSTTTTQTTSTPQTTATTTPKSSEATTTPKTTETDNAKAMAEAKKKAEEEKRKAEEAKLKAQQAQQAQAQQQAEEQAYQNSKKAAIALYNQGKYEQALLKFQKLREQRPNDSSVKLYIQKCQNNL